MKNVRISAAVIALLVLVGACGDAEVTSTTSGNPTTTPAPPVTGGPGASEFTPGETVRLDLPLATEPVSNADLAAVVAADAAFGLDLFAVAAGDENLMISPYSIATALSMLYPGARGTTASEIADVLHLAVDDATLHAAATPDRCSPRHHTSSPGTG